MARGRKTADKISEQLKLREELIQKAVEHEKVPQERGWHGGVKVCIPTGLANLDIISARDPDGIYGFPDASVILMYGEPAVAKTTLALMLIGAAQKPDPLGRRPPMTGHYIETESSHLSREYMELQGVDLKALLTFQPDTKEDAFDAIKALQIGLLRLKPEKRIPYFHVLDSTSIRSREEAALPVGKGKDDKAKASSKALHARIHSERLRDLHTMMRQTRSVLLLVGQAKEDMNWSPGGSRVQKKTTLGSKPMVFHSVLTFLVSRGAELKEPGDDHAGMMVYIKNEKNKAGLAPFGRAENLELWRERGFDRRLALHDALAAKGLLTVGRGRNANLYTFMLQTGAKRIQYKERYGIHDLPEGAIKVMTESLALSKEQREKLWIKEK